MYSVLGKLGFAAVLTAFAFTPANSNEISLSLRATVEPKCVVLGVAPGANAAEQSFAVTVSCNTPQFVLSFVDTSGPVTVDLLGAAGANSPTLVNGSALAVSARAPGLHVFDLQLAEDQPMVDNLTIQLEGF